jgi:hypothetical protein
MFGSLGIVQTYVRMMTMGKADALLEAVRICAASVKYLLLTIRVS